MTFLTAFRHRYLKKTLVAAKNCLLDSFYETIVEERIWEIKTANNDVLNSESIEDVLRLRSDSKLYVRQAVPHARTFRLQGGTDGSLEKIETEFKDFSSVVDTCLSYLEQAVDSEVADVVLDVVNTALAANIL